MLRKSRIAWLIGGVSLVVLVGALCFESPADAFRHSFRGVQFEVKVTNLTRGQIFSPAVVVTHSKKMEPLFRLGEPPSEELAMVAEDAVLDPLIEQLKESDQVGSVEVLKGAGGPILPGETAAVTVEASPRALQVSLVGMLVTTNDGFYALNGETGPIIGSRSSFLHAYDAGSEANNELCAFIPGPPCGSHGVRATDEAEGFVHIHAGIHGVGDLDAAEFDWRNPVALVTIRRVKE